MSTDETREQIMERLGITEEQVTEYLSHFPGARSTPMPGEARASAECPLCGIDTPHSHSKHDVEQWATNQVACWGYEVTLQRHGTAKAIEVHECAACGHERTGDLREVSRPSGSVRRWICDECEGRRTAKAADSSCETSTCRECHEELERLPLTHVACKDTDGRIWAMPAPFRHHHLLRVMHDHGAKCAEDNHFSQGFLDASGRYLHRKAARVSAELNDQIKNGKIIGGVLTSEDLW